MKLTTVLLFLTPFLIYTDQTIAGFSASENELIYEPWFTGPLLAPTPINMAPGHPAMEPSVTFFNNYGRYNNDWKVHKQDSFRTINPFMDFQFGITDYLGVESLISFVSNFKDGQSFSHFQDTVILFGYQVSNDIKGSWVPDFRLILQETFPTGNYQRLNPNKHGIDSTGAGSFQTGPVLAFRKLFHFPHHFLSLRWSINYLFPSSVHVKGLNTYGGSHDTKGQVKPGQNLTAFFSGEFSLNQRWVLAFDSEFFYQKRSHFSGRNGTTPLGTPAKTGLPTTFLISFAPELEYNLTPTSGLLSGLWFTLAGKNSAAFSSAFMAYVYIF